MFSLDTINSNYPTFAPRTPARPGSGVKKLTRDPINTGTSVLGLVFQGGVAIVADTLISYGSMARFNNIPRVLKVNDKTIIGSGGDFADFQYVQDIIKKRTIQDECIDDGFTMNPKALFNRLTGLLYNRRSKFDPLWNIYLIAGFDNDTPFLGFIDKLGTAFQDEMIATGFGMHLALPIMRKAMELAKPRGGLTEQEAVEVLTKCQEVLYYRDARSWPEYHIGIVTKDGVKVEGPIQTKSDWNIADVVQGYE